MILESLNKSCVKTTHETTQPNCYFRLHTLGWNLQVMISAYYLPKSKFWYCNEDINLIYFYMCQCLNDLWVHCIKYHQYEILFEQEQELKNEYFHFSVPLSYHLCRWAYKHHKLRSGPTVCAQPICNGFHNVAIIILLWTPWPKLE